MAARVKSMMARHIYVTAMTVERCIRVTATPRSLRHDSNRDRRRDSRIPRIAPFLDMIYIMCALCVCSRCSRTCSTFVWLTWVRRRRLPSRHAVMPCCSPWPRTLSCVAASRPRCYGIGAWQSRAPPTLMHSGTGTWRERWYQTIHLLHLPECIKQFVSRRVMVLIVWLWAVLVV